MTAIDQILHDHNEQQKLIVDETKTIKEWFEQKLPEPYKELALRCFKQQLHIKTNKFEVAICSTYPWKNMPLGETFWDEMWEYASNRRNTLPLIPGIHTEPQQISKPIAEKTIKVKQVEQPVKMITEVYTTKHVIPYNNGRLPLFASL